MTFGQAVSSGFKNYTVATGRASRSEFWYWYLFFVLVTAIPYVWLFVALVSTAASTPSVVASATLFPNALLVLVVLALAYPSICLQIRRLHDTNRSGFWWWIGLVPFVGSIILIVFFLLPSVDEGNRYN